MPSFIAPINVDVLIIKKSYKSVADGKLFIHSIAAPYLVSWVRGPNKNVVADYFVQRPNERRRAVLIVRKVGCISRTIDGGCQINSIVINVGDDDRAGRSGVTLGYKFLCWKIGAWKKGYLEPSDGSLYQNTTIGNSLVIPNRL